MLAARGLRTDHEHGLELPHNRTSATVLTAHHRSLTNRRPMSTVVAVRSWLPRATRDGAPSFARVVAQVDSTAAAEQMHRDCRAVPARGQRG